MKRWSGSLLALVVSSVLGGCATGVDHQAATSRPPISAEKATRGHSAPSLGFATVVSAKLQLQGLHLRMVGEHLALWHASIGAFQVLGEGVRGTLLPNSTIWAADGAEPRPVGAVDVFSERLPESDRTAIAALPVGSPVLAVVRADHELLALAPLTSGEELRTDFDAEGILYLGKAALALAREGVTLPPVGLCLSVSAERMPNSPVGALKRYLGLVGNYPVLARLRDNAIRSRAADSLERGAGPFIDGVTGDAVPADANDIAAQLQRGVPETSVHVHATVPVEIDTAGAALGESSVVEFVDSSDKILGWVNIAPELEGTTLRSYVGVPAAGASVLVYVRTLGEDFSCAPPTGTTARVTIPYNDFAGARRAKVKLGTRTYVKL